MGILMYISKISDKLDKQNRIIVIETLVLSLIDYCIKIWRTTNDKTRLIHRNCTTLQEGLHLEASGSMTMYLQSLGNWSG